MGSTGKRAGTEVGRCGWEGACAGARARAVRAFLTWYLASSSSALASSASSAACAFAFCVAASRCAACTAPAALAASCALSSAASSASLIHVAIAATPQHTALARAAPALTVSTDVWK